MAGQSDLELLERVFFRFIQAETPDKIEPNLKFLVPVLAKLSSTDERIKKKTLELIGHINKKLKENVSVKLPMSALLTFYADCKVPVAQNVTLIYIKMGLSRINNAQKVELLPQLLQCLEGKIQKQQLSILQLIVSCLMFVNNADEKLTELFKPISENSKVAKVVLDFMMDWLVLPYDYRIYQPKVSTPAPSSSADSSSGASQESASASDVPLPSGPPQLLSENGMKNVLGDSPPDPDDLEKIKLAILDILKTGIFSPNDIFCPVLAASFDMRRKTVGDAAIAELQRITPNIDQEIDEEDSEAMKELKRIACKEQVDLDDMKLIQRLYSMFQGTVPVKGKPVDPGDKISPASVELRKEIFKYLSESKSSPKFPNSIQIIQGNILANIKDNQLKRRAMVFAKHAAANWPAQLFAFFAKVLLPSTLKFIGDNKDHPDLRLPAYETVGIIGSRDGNLVNKDVSIVKMLFNSMATETIENQQAVKVALIKMIPAFKRDLISDVTNETLENLLMDNVEKPQAINRLCAAQYSNGLYPSDHVSSRYVLLTCFGDLKDEVYEEACRGMPTLTAYTDSRKKHLMPAEPEPMPNFLDMVKYIYERQNERLLTSKKYMTANQIIAFNPVTFGKIMMYFRLLLTRDAGVKPDLSSLAAMKAQVPLIAEYVQKLADGEDVKDGPVSVYTDFTKQLAYAFPGVPPMYCFLEIVAIAREHLAPIYIKELHHIKNHVSSPRQEMRETAAELLGILIAYGAYDNQRYGDQLTDLIPNLDGKTLTCRHGTVLALGYLFGYMAVGDRHRAEKQRLEDARKEEEAQRQQEVDTGEEENMEEEALGVEKVSEEMDENSGSRMEEHTTPSGTDNAEGASMNKGVEAKDIDIEMNEEDNQITENENEFVVDDQQPSTSSTGPVDQNEVMGNNVTKMLQKLGGDGESGLPKSFEELMSKIDTEPEEEKGVSLGELQRRAQEYENRVYDIADLKSKALTKIVSFLKGKDELMIQGACDSLGEMGRQGALDIPDGDADTDQEDVITKLSIIKQMLDIVKNAGDFEQKKTLQKAALSLGKMCLGRQDFTHKEIIIEGLLCKSCTAELDPDTLVAIGNGLLMAAEGPVSPIARDHFLQTEDMYMDHVCDSNNGVEILLKKLLDLPKSQPHSTKAVQIWLQILCECSHRHELIKKSLPTIRKTLNEIA